MHSAMALLNRMRAHGVEPDVVTYNLLIRAQCLDGHIDSAFRLLRLMEGDDLAADMYTYNALVDALCKDGRIDQACSLFDSLEVRGKKT